MDDLLPALARVKDLRELMSAEDLHGLYQIFADRARQVAALLRGDPDQLGQQQLEMAVHDIKGTAANLGLERVAEAAGVVLDLARTQGAAQAARGSQQLIPLLERLPAALAGEDLMRLLAQPG
jgi:HPt (histidine-containing phosphotransfer) domain-containing protein